MPSNNAPVRAWTLVSIMLAAAAPAGCGEEAAGPAEPAVQPGATSALMANTARAPRTIGAMMFDISTGPPNATTVMNLISGTGKLPFNTDGGGLCSNHPANRGGITKIIEAVRQLRGEAHPAVQVKNCNLAIAHGTGGSLGTRHCGSTVILERE